MSKCLGLPLDFNLRTHKHLADECARDLLERGVDLVGAVSGPGDAEYDAIFYGRIGLAGSIGRRMDCPVIGDSRVARGALRKRGCAAHDQ